MLSRRIHVGDAFLSSHRASPRVSPAWMKDAVDAAIVAGLLLTLTLLAL